MTTLINVADYEKAAREKMQPMFYDYCAGGADDQITLHENQQAYRRMQLQYRVLCGIEQCKTGITLLGNSLSMPIVIAPTAMQCLAHPDGELAMARAVEKAGTLFILSTPSTYSMEDVMKASKGAKWFQLYVYKDKNITQSLVERAEAAGYSALVVTVDGPVIGNREADVRNGFRLPPEMKLMNLVDTRANLSKDTKGSAVTSYATAQLKADISWQYIEWLRSITKMPIWIKGICHPDDAKIAVDRGMAGIVVSNHGGRQLDTSPATIDILPEIVRAVKGRLSIMIDGGIRRGTDVVKALALGANVVAIGRPPLWGLAANGEAGVSHVLQIFRQELERAMMLCGVATIADLKPNLIRR